MISARGILLLMVVVLSGCLGQSRLNATIRFNAPEHAEVVADFAKKSIQELAAKYGGTCPERNYGTYCSVEKMTKQIDSSTLSSGIGKDGNAFVSIRTSHTHLLWAFEKGMKDGRYISDFHKELERWAVETFSEFEPQTRTRSYSGYGVVGSF